MIKYYSYEFLDRNTSNILISIPVSSLIQAVLGCLPISEPSLNQEALKIVRIGVRLAKGFIILSILIIHIYTTCFPRSNTTN